MKFVDILLLLFLGFLYAFQLLCKIILLLVTALFCYHMIDSLYHGQFKELIFLPITLLMIYLSKLTLEPYDAL